MRPWMLSDVNLQEVRENAYEVAVLPFGAVEPHNLHLPYGCDALHAEALAARCCEHAHGHGGKVICLPAIPYGVDTNLMRFPMTMNLNPSTQAAIVSDIVSSLETHGIPKCVIFNSHGGNSFRGIIRELRGKTSVFLSLTEWWKTVTDVIEEVCENTPGEHGDEMETSVALALFGELVKMDQADAGQIKPSTLQGLNSGVAWTSRPWHLLTTHAGVGDPRKATRQKGERIVDAVTQRIGDYLLELANTPIDETFPY